LLLQGLMALTRMVDENLLANTMQELYVTMSASIRSSMHAYAHGTFSEIMTQRTADVLLGYSNMLVAAFLIFPLFLFGLYAGKKHIFQNIDANLSLIKKTWQLGLIIGLVMSIVKFIAKSQMAGDQTSFYSVIHVGAGFFGDTGLALFLITSTVLLCRNKEWLLKLKPLTYIGRMPLSNYLFQSIVCTMIFYSYGFGLYGKVGTALGLILAIGIFIIQIFISKYWLKYYQFGPMEWIWKSLTYGKIFKMKRL